MASDDREIDDAGARLEASVTSLAKTFGLTPDERDTLVRIGTWHDEVQDLISVSLGQAFRRDSSGIDIDYLTAQSPVIIETMHNEMLPYRDLLGRLGQAELTEAVVALCLGGDVDEPSVFGLQLLVEAMSPVVPHRARVAVEYLRGRVADRMGSGLDAETAFERALAFDPQWVPALEWLAALANDRGDADRALSLLDRAGVSPDDGLYRMLVKYRPGNVVSLQRNDPCWCGSGRKLKQCHRGAEPLPLTTRASWLWHKAMAFVQDGPWRSEIFELAAERSRYGGDREMFEALSDPLLLSAMFIEGEVLDEYAYTRGPLLPADELELLRSWNEVDRGLYEVEEVHRDEGLLVRNVLDGERVFVPEVLGSRDSYVGMLFVSLVLPVGDATFGFFGGIEPVSLQHRERVMQLLDSMPDPFELVSAMTDRFAPPQLVTKEGDALELCTTVIAVKGRKSIARAFDSQFRRESETEWIAGVDGGTVEEGDSIGGSLTLDGRRVTINTTSRARTDLVLDVVESLGFEFSLVSESVVNVGESVLSAASESVKPASVPSLDDPEVAAMFAEYIAKYERDWLDMDIPALGGLTPREAAVDPIARNDLIALLNSFPRGHPNTMDADRLRAALGLLD